MNALAQVVAWLNSAANAVGGLVLAPIGMMPGWLSATLVGAATGILMLVVFKYTSNQKAIKAARNDIKANLLALKLFKDSAAVTSRIQGRILLGALRLLVLAIVPMLVMLIPMTLLLGQLALWYQARPLRVGEEAVLIVKLNGGAEVSWPKVSLTPTDAVKVTVGPVRVQSQRELCWNIQAHNLGYHQLVFLVDGQPAEKELAIGDGWMRVSLERPGWSWSAMLLHPAEEPFGPDNPIRSIAIDYLQRSSMTSGTDWWVCYWFGVSIVAALCFRRLLGVNM